MIQQNSGPYDCQGRRKYLSRQESLVFVRAVMALPTRERLLCQVIYYAGCRPTEAIRLKAKDLDVLACAFQVVCLKKRGKQIIRRVPLPQWLTAELIEIGPGHSDGRFWPISRVTVWRLIKGVMAPLGIDGLQSCPKGLRHSFAVRGVQARVPLHMLQKWMGHSNSQTTAIYLDVQDEEERELMARMWGQDAKPDF